MNKKCFWFLALSFVSIEIVATQISDTVAPELTNKIKTKRSVVANNYMVSAAHPLAVEAGYNVLKEGGSAADALVTIQTILGLVEPQSSGLGGGAFLLYYNAEKKTLTSYDGRETAPNAARPSLFQDKEGKPLKFFDAVVGGRSVGTPSTVKLLAQMHKMYGKKKWASLLQPAIELASKGFVVSERLAFAVQQDKARLSRYPDTKTYFFTANGETLKQGSLLINKAYADTLTKLAKKGQTAFYSGQIAKDIVEKVQNLPFNAGELAFEDFAAYQIIERAPVCIEYHKYNVCGMGPPSSGAITLGQILGIVSRFDLKKIGANEPLAWQIIGDASRLAFADRGRYIADPDFVPIPEGLLDSNYLTQRAALITKGKALVDVKPGNPFWYKPVSLADGESIELPSTSHIVIVDKKGNIISMTSSIENGFGSRVMSNGFLLNNQLTDFSFAPQKEGYLVANRVEPRKRPRSSMTPTIVFKEGKPYMAIGSPGGSNIIGYVAQTIIAHLDWGMDIQEAINMPRMLNRFGTFEIEQSTHAVRFIPALQKMGFKTAIHDLNSGVHAVIFDGEKMIGGADPRREGIVLGD